MADNSLRTPGSGETVRSVDKTAVKAQVVIIDKGGSGAEEISAIGNTSGMFAQGAAAADLAVAGNPVLLGARASAVVPTDMSADADAVTLWALRNGALVVNPRSDVFPISVTSTTVTTVTTAYSIGDVVGPATGANNGIWTFANAVRFSGGTGTIVKGVLSDVGDVFGPSQLYLYRSTPGTGHTDNSAFSAADADTLLLVAILNFPPLDDCGGSRAGTVLTSDVFDATATSLFGVLVTRTANAVFAANTDLKITLYIVRD